MRKEHTYTRKLTAWLVGIAMAATFFFSAYFVIAHAEHDCSGENCSVCVHIQQYSQTIKKLGAGSWTAGAAFVLDAGSSAAVLSAISPAKPESTLVQLKVRLDN